MPPIKPLKKKSGCRSLQSITSSTVLKINTSTELVRYAAGAVTPVIEGLKGTRRSPLPGYRVKLLDGNCIEASEHRIAELRSLSAGALPGKSLVVYDPVLGIPVDVFPCEDGHAQERSLLNQVLPTVKKGEVWVADRNFCVVEFICGIDDKDAHVIVFRQHGNLPYTELGKERAVGKIETGKVFEQPIMVTDDRGKPHQFRRIRILLEEQTRDGDKEIWLYPDFPTAKYAQYLVVKRFIRISNARNSVDFCSISPCAKDSS